MNYKCKYKFNDNATFLKLEDMAIDGILDYSNFPAIEYKYFSKLSKLGYNNRNNGWDMNVCINLQEEYRQDYYAEKSEADSFLNLSKKIQNNILKAGQLQTKCYKVDSKEQVLQLLLEIVEKLSNENGFQQRINERFKQ